MNKQSIKKTVGTAGRIAIVAAAFIGYSSASVSAGASGTDPMRCEALKLRCDSRYHMCLSRCDAFADRRAARAPEDAEGVRRSCSDTCERRHFRKQQRLEQRAICNAHEPETTPPAPANPQTCAAQLLWVKADYMQCIGNCHSRSDRRPEFDCDDCVSACYDKYRADTDDSSSDPVCSEGPAEPVELEAEPSACTETD